MRLGKSGKVKIRKNKIDSFSAKEKIKNRVSELLIFQAVTLVRVKWQTIDNYTG